MATRKSFDKERWEAMTGMEMSQLLPECENPESAGGVTDHAGNEILPTVTEQFGIQEPAEKDGSAPASKCRISGRQRRLSHQTGFYRTRNAVMELLEKLKVIMNKYKK